MGWEYLTYEAWCENCGKRGFCTRGMDDWNRTSTSWEGFEQQAPSPTAVGTKRADKRDAVAICGCSAPKIKIGNVVAPE